MKKIVLLFITIMLNTALSAQQTYILDNNFENYLETHDSFGNISSFNTMGNGIANDHYVSTSNIDSVMFLNISNLNILDLTGIEAFSSLAGLNCSNNQLNNIDISNSTSLVSLICHNNLLINLNVSYLSSLTILDCSYNQISSLDLSQNWNLVELYCRNNQLTNLDLRNQNNSNFDDFIAINNPNLICIEVDDSTWSTANWTDIDNIASFNESCQNSSNETYVPDDNFEHYLETHDEFGNIVVLGDVTSMGNGTANDDYVTTANINTVTTLNIQFQNISNLTGIENFTALNYLYCNNNNLQTLSVVQNTALVFLICSSNQLVSLDISSNTALTFLNCHTNQLSSLNVLQNTALKYLYTYNNQLSNLDVSNNTALIFLHSYNNQINFLDTSNNTLLEQLYFNNNQLNSLDISNNPALERLHCSNNKLVSLTATNGSNYLIGTAQFDVRNNPDLTCIQVDSVAYSTANWVNIDSTASFSIDCQSNNNETYVPDDNFENYLETHDEFGNMVALGNVTSMGNGIANDDYVTTANINTVINLSIAFKYIADLTGIEDFSALKQLNCIFNQLSSLDMSHNTNLTKLDCTLNQLTTLNISNNLNLDSLRCDLNQLTTLNTSSSTVLTLLHCSSNSLIDLDVSGSIFLNGLYCNNNQLISLDVSLNTALEKLNCSNNQLTSLNAANGNNTNISNPNFNTINNPDLTCIQVDNATWSTANWTNIDSITSFGITCRINNNETYVPDDNFENYLETHDEFGNTVTLGDVTSMGNGTANDNYVTTANINTVINLDVHSKNIADLTGIEDFEALINLYCYVNQLSYLDVSHNTSLKILVCANNYLNVLDMSQNIVLEKLYCYNNNLNNLGLTQNTMLTQLYCSNNNLNNLDLTQNTTLTYLWCSQNQLTNLNVKNGNNTNFTFFKATNNPDLTCILVDNASWSTAFWTDIDSTSTFVNSQIECDAIPKTDFSIYPNPATDVLNIQSKQNAFYSIFNINNSKQVKSGNLLVGHNRINITNLLKGIYFIKITSNTNTFTKKLIIK